uniref:PGG domain-containing protein n=1 Tax=Chenopodium quinoa TaxID=63459 RepID=A0A803LXW7_CHEQI
MKADEEFGTRLVNEAPEFITEKDNNEQSASDKAYEIGPAWFIKAVLDKDPFVFNSAPLVWTKACEKGHVLAIYAFINHNPGASRDLCIEHKGSPFHHIRLPNLTGSDKIIYDIKDDEDISTIDLLAQECGNNQAWDIGDALLATKAAFLVFLISNTLALFFSMLVLICLIWSMVYDSSKSLFLIDRSMVLLRLALYNTLLVFMNGVYIVIAPKTLWAAILIIVIMSSLIGISINKMLLYTVLEYLDKLITSPTKKPKDQIRVVELGISSEQDRLLAIAKES